ncbi:MAG: hypothetical protein JXA64_10835, partial [Candidatus Fermentibacteraceae bacterium]|nr:hypothetical protein [Candidatus Fermentibacteraceae bacterium]
MKHLLLAALLLAAVSVQAGQLTVAVPLDPSAISFDDAGIYTAVTGTGMNLTGLEGEPALPVFAARVALPT